MTTVLYLSLEILKNFSSYSRKMPNHVFNEAGPLSDAHREVYFYSFVDYRNYYNEHERKT